MDTTTSWARPAAVLLLTVGLPAASWASQASPCGTSPGLSALLHDVHRQNLQAREGQGPGLAPPPGGLGDRIQNDLLVLEDSGDLVINGVTDTLEILDRAVALAGDRFDFLTVLVASSFPGDVSPETGFAFYQRINQSISGVGLPPLADPGMPVLRGIINLNDLDEYPSGPAAPVAGFNGLATGLEVLGHETAHLAGAYVTLPAAQLLGRDDAHWSFFLNSHGSVLEGNLWQDNQDGTFTTAAAALEYATYGQLDLYLLGLIPASQVTDPIFVIKYPTVNPGQWRYSFPQAGFTTGGTRADVLISDIVSVYGDRVPAWPAAASQFTMAFVLVVPFNQAVSGADLSLATQFRTQFELWFSQQTGGRGAVQTSIPPIPVGGDFTGLPRAGGPAPLTVQFDARPTGGFTGVEWDFGDGATSTQLDPVHVYTANGSFTVKLRVDGEGGPSLVEKPGFVSVGSFATLLSDDFEIERGWSASPQDTATGGRWQRADPEATWVGSVMAQPEDDHTASAGSVTCWVTGAPAGSTAGSYDVDGGATMLISPSFSLEGMENAWLSYHYWYTNDLGSSPGSDLMRAQISNDDGASWIDLAQTSDSASWWRYDQVPLAGVLPATSLMRVRFVASDYGDSSLVEAALDDVSLIALPGGDADLDGVADAADNCAGLFNPSQADSDADGPGDACDCAPSDPLVSALPGEIGATLDLAGAGALSWTGIDQATGYNLYRGSFGMEPITDWNHSCLESNLATPAFSDPAVPPPGGIFYYLPTAVNCFGEGGAGEGSGATPRPIASPC